MAQNKIPKGIVKVRNSQTKPNKDAKRVLKHSWNFDFSDCPLDDLIDGFITAEVIRRQSLIRQDFKKGRELRWPEGVVTVKVAEELRTPTRQGPSLLEVTVAALLAAPSPEAKAKVLAEAPESVRNTLKAILSAAPAAADEGTDEDDSE